MRKREKGGGEENYSQDIVSWSITCFAVSTSHNCTPRLPNFVVIAFDAVLLWQSLCATFYFSALKFCIMACWYVWSVFTDILNLYFLYCFYTLSTLQQRNGLYLIITSTKGQQSPAHTHTIMTFADLWRGRKGEITHLVVCCGKMAAPSRVLERADEPGPRLRQADVAPRRDAHPHHLQQAAKHTGLTFCSVSNLSTAQLQLCLSLQFP